MKILPELLKSVEFGGGGPKVFSFVMNIGSKLSDEEYETALNPVIVRLFASPDRQIRVCLLDNLPQMIDHLSQKIVTDKIFPQLVSSPHSHVPAGKVLMIPGYWIHGRRPCSTRANRQSGLDHHK